MFARTELVSCGPRVRTIGLRISQDVAPSLLKILTVGAFTWGYALLFRTTVDQTMLSVGLTLVGLALLWGAVVAATDRSLKTDGQEKEVGHRLVVGARPFFPWFEFVASR